MYGQAMTNVPSGIQLMPMNSLSTDPLAETERDASLDDIPV